MSNYKAKAINPKTGNEEEADFFDDYFGKHKYGVRFHGGKKVYPIEKITIPQEKVEAKSILEQFREKFEEQDDCDVIHDIETCQFMQFEHFLATIKDQMLEEVEKLCKQDGMPCCKVCACENGKKIHCACHRQQLRQNIINKFGE